MFGVRKKKGVGEGVKRKTNTRVSSLELDKSRREGAAKNERLNEPFGPNARVLYAASAPPVMAPYDLARVFS